MVVKRVALGLAATAAAGLVYSAGYEVRSYRLRRFDVPVLAPGSRPLRVLHVSDLHLTPGHRGRAAWVRRLAALEPDLVVNTGDNLSHRDAIPTVLDALGPLLDLPGVFVFGSNDYFAPRPKNPARYLLPLERIRRQNARDHADAVDLPWKELRDELSSAGWLDLTNTFGSLTVDGRRLAFAGVDDPHLNRDRLGDVAGPAADADLAIGWRTRRTSGSSTPSIATGTNCCSPATPTAASCASPATARWSPTATSTPPASRASPGTPGSAAPAPPGCTSRPASARRRTRGSGSPARPRRRC